jgi:hypothetical protein
VGLHPREKKELDARRNKRAQPPAVGRPAPMQLEMELRSLEAVRETAAVILTDRGRSYTSAPKAPTWGLDPFRGRADLSTGSPLTARSTSTSTTPVTRVAVDPGRRERGQGGLPRVPRARPGPPLPAGAKAGAADRPSARARDPDRLATRPRATRGTGQPAADAPRPGGRLIHPAASSTAGTSPQRSSSL